MGAGQRGAVQAGEGVQQLAHRGRAGQALPGVLTVDVEQMVGQLAQLGQCGGTAVDPGAALAAAVDHAAQQQGVVHVKAGLVQPAAQMQRQVELGTDLGLGRALAHHAGVAAPAQGQLQRVDQDGLAGAGLAGQHGKAGIELEFERRHDDKVFEAEMPQHGWSRVNKALEIPAQLAPQRRVIAPALGVQKAHLVLAAPHRDGVAVQQAGQALHVEVHRRVAAGDDLHAHLALVGQHDGPVGQGVGRNRHQQPAGDAGMQDGPAGRQRIGGGAGGRGDDQTVGPHIGDELVADLDLQLHHAGRGATADHHIVEGQPREDGLAVAQHRAFQHRARFHLVIAGQHRRQRLAPALGGDVGDEAQPALVDAQQRDAVTRHFTGKAEHGAVAANHHRQVALAAQLVGGQRFIVGEAGVERGVRLQRDIQALAAQKFGNLFQHRPDARRLMLAHDGDMSEALGHAANYTTGVLPVLAVHGRFLEWRPCSTSDPNPCSKPWLNGISPTANPWVRAPCPRPPAWSSARPPSAT
mmetsp:Transcript_4846/g.17211  ORF Transcript_4846/g.17211 Transcript_4846/m.17211 type:complete len:524 (+) Transcript_4846:2418-3989(+)